MRRIILSPVACPVLQYFATLPHKEHNFRKKKKKKKKNYRINMYDYYREINWRMMRLAEHAARDKTRNAVYPTAEYGQRTYNMAQWRVRVTNVAMEKQQCLP